MDMEGWLVKEKVGGDKSNRDGYLVLPTNKYESYSGNGPEN